MTPRRDNQPSHTIAVRRYGLLHPRDWTSDCDVEMAGQTRLWNRLVEIERAHREIYRRVTSNAAVESAQAELDAAIDRRDGLIAERAALRKTARTKIKTPELDAAITEARGAIAPLVERARLLRREARDASRAAIATAEEARKAAVKLARQQCGLYWGNYNAIVTTYERARMAALRSGAELRERRKPADRITNQLQGGMTAAELFAAASSQIGAEPHTEGSRQCHLLTARIDRAGTTCRWPMIMHRPLPDDARIQEVVITREAVGARWRWSAIFTCRVPAPWPAGAQEAACGIDVGWRKVDDGLRVAVIASERTRAMQEIVLPAELVARFEHLYDLGSIRHRARSEMLRKLSAADWSRAPTALAQSAAALFALRDEHGQLAASGLALRTFVAQWRACPETTPCSAGTMRRLPALYAEAEQWAAADRTMWLARTNGMDTVIAARREFYRALAARLVADHGLIGLEKLDLTAMAARDRTPLAGIPRRQRTIAGLSALRQAITSAAKREGVRVHYHDGKSSFVCAACYAETAVANRALLYFTCGGCGATLDQDHNAARNLLAAARASAPVASDEPPALAWQKRLRGKELKRAERTVLRRNDAETTGRSK